MTPREKSQVMREALKSLADVARGLCLPHTAEVLALEHDRLWGLEEDDHVGRVRFLYRPVQAGRN